MTIKKLSGSLVAATILIGLNTVVMADETPQTCDELITHTEDLATYLRFPEDGVWPDEAIWQWKGKGSMGCAVHEKLARQLNEENPEYDEEEMPPYKGAKTRKGNNLAAGAANELRNGNLESAVGHFVTFIDTINSYMAAKLNEDYGPKLPDDTESDFPTAEDAAKFFRGEAESLSSLVYPLCGP